MLTHSGDPVMSRSVRIYLSSSCLRHAVPAVAVRGQRTTAAYYSRPEALSNAPISSLQTPHRQLSESKYLGAYQRYPRRKYCRDASSIRLCHSGKSPSSPNSSGPSLPSRLFRPSLHAHQSDMYLLPAEAASGWRNPSVEKGVGDTLSARPAVRK